MKRAMAFFFEKKGETGLNASEIMELPNLIDTDWDDLFPAEIEASEAESQALGFVNGKLYKAMDWDMEPLKALLLPVLNGTEPESSNGRWAPYALTLPDSSDYDLWYYTLVLPDGAKYDVQLARPKAQ